MHREDDNSTKEISYFFLYSMSIAVYKVKKSDIKIKKNLNSPNLNELISSKMSTWQKPASQRLTGRPSNPPWVYPATGCASQSSDVDVSYVLTKLEHVPSQMRKTTKLTTLEKWPKNLWKRVPLHTPMQWHGTPGNRLKRKHQTCMAMIRYYNIDFSKKNYTGAPNENRVQNRLNIALLNVF